MKLQPLDSSRRAGRDPVSFLRNHNHYQFVATTTDFCVAEDGFDTQRGRGGGGKEGGEAGIL